MFVASKYAPLYSTSEGYITYRKDILDALGMDEPTTVEEWHEAYRAVHEAYPEMTVVMERGASNIIGMVLPEFHMVQYGDYCGFHGRPKGIRG